MTKDSLFALIFAATALISSGTANAFFEKKLDLHAIDNSESMGKTERYATIDREFKTPITVKAGETIVKSKIMERKTVNTAKFDSEITVKDLDGDEVATIVKTDYEYEIAGEITKGDKKFKLICILNCTRSAWQELYILADESGAIDPKVHWHSQNKRGFVVDAVKSQFELSATPNVKFGSKTNERQVDAHKYVFEKMNNQGRPVVSTGGSSVGFTEGFRMNMFASNAFLTVKEVVSDDTAIFEVLGRKR